MAWNLCARPWSSSARFVDEPPWAFIHINPVQEIYQNVRESTTCLLSDFRCRANPVAMHVAAMGRVVYTIKLVLLPRTQSLPSCLKKPVQCKVMVIRPQRQVWLEKNMSTLALRGGAPNLFAMRVVSADFASSLSISAVELDSGDNVTAGSVYENPLDWYIVSFA